MNAIALEIAHNGLGNVDGKDYRRNQQVPAVVPQPREYLKRDRAQGPRQRRVLLDDREPACRGRAMRRVRPLNDREHDGNDDENGEAPHILRWASHPAKYEASTSLSHGVPGPVVATTDRQ